MTSIYEMEKEIKSAIQHRIKGSMSLHDNVLYFPNNIDVRLCPKNGITTLKWCLFDCMGYAVREYPDFARKVGTALHRRDEIKKHGYSTEYPFRRGSRRIAIVRDPIERFMSAAEFLKQQWEINKDSFEGNEIKKGWNKLADLDRIPDTIDGVIEQVELGEIYNSHFFPQAYYLGNRGQYDEIYKFSQFHKFLTYLDREVDSKKPLYAIHENKSGEFGKFFGPVSDLTEEQKERIVNIFKQDYEYGWTEKNARTL